MKKKKIFCSHLGSNPLASPYGDYAIPVRIHEGHRMNSSVKAVDAYNCFTVVNIDHISIPQAISTLN